MRRLACTLCMLALAGCSRSRPAPLPEASAELLSEIQVADPHVFEQLVGGFYQVENHAWRWTGPKFSVVLRPPAGAASAGARLELHFVLLANVLDQLGPMEVHAAVNGYTPAPETFSQPGEQVYRRDIPAEPLRANGVLVEFSTGKAFSEGGGRELALVATSVGLLRK